MSLSPGRTFGRYQVLSKLGAGGMGEVYLAQDTRLKRKVALKVLPAELIHDADRLHRFEQEAQAASSLNQPNIITIHEIGLEDGIHFIATEYIEGKTLRQKLQEARLDIAETLNIITQMAAALDAAHRSGIVHRDVKPENVMVRDDGLVKVLDFGLAKLTEAKSGERADTQAPTEAFGATAPGIVMGTVAYMSPEQARGKQIDERTDIFSFGTVIYEMLTGSLPFEGETASDVIAAILKNEPAPPRALNQGIPSELERIVSKAMAKDREERYQTSKDLLVDLRRLMKQTEIQAEKERSGSHIKTEHYTRGQTMSKRRVLFVVAAAFLLLTGIAGYRLLTGLSSNKQIESIAVLPFQNVSGNADLEYLSDGMTESLIDSLSQLPNLSVKARSSVFRFKGREHELQRVAEELSVEAILNGRVVQRGADLTLYLSLIECKTGNQLWGEQYNRKLTDILALQSEIARDVSQKLRARLSGEEEKQLSKNYTENVEAYQLYLKGRYHIFKLKPRDIQTGIEHFQQAIEIDPTYPLAYVGLANAYRGLALSVDLPPNEFLPKAKSAALKAIEIDETLAEAHAALGILMFWYDWDWKGAENQYLRALELNPNSADTHFGYAHLLSNMGRHDEALARIKRATELDPLSSLISAAAGLCLLQAGRTNEALTQFQKTLELDPNFWLARMFASSACIDKGMLAEAIAEARKAKEISGISTNPDAFLGYALAKSGHRVEAQALLDGLLKLSEQRYIPPYHIAMIYNGMDDREEALRWLERGVEQRDPKMIFLNVERKWNPLHSDPRFQVILRRVGFTP